MLANILSPRSN